MDGLMQKKKNVQIPFSRLINFIEIIQVTTTIRKHYISQFKFVLSTYNKIKNYDNLIKKIKEFKHEKIRIQKKVKKSMS